MAGGYLIGPEFAENLRETVARVKGQVQVSQKLGTSSMQDDGYEGPPEHYLSKTTATWTKGTSQTLTLWGGTPGSEEAVADVTIEAWNYVATLPSGLWVVLARTNAAFYLSSFDYTGLSGYSGSAQQILAHNTSGQLVWLNTTACT